MTKLGENTILIGIKLQLIEVQELSMCGSMVLSNPVKIIFILFSI